MEKHATNEEIVDVARSIYNELHYGCPGCSLKILSVLISMLILHYTKTEEEHGEIFDYKKWVEFIVKEVLFIIDKYEHQETKVN